MGNTRCSPDRPAVQHHRPRLDDNGPALRERLRCGVRSKFGQPGETDRQRDEQQRDVDDGELAFAVA